jgi:hypothetical protein
MRRSRRREFTFVWSLWLICLVIATAPACLTHPAAHNHDVTHPPLCIDTSSPIAQRDGKPILFPDGGSFPLPSKSLPPGFSSAAISMHLPWGLGLAARSPFPTHAHTLLSPPRISPVVLRL